MSPEPEAGFITLDEVMTAYETLQDRYTAEREAHAVTSAQAWQKIHQYEYELGELAAERDAALAELEKLRDAAQAIAEMDPEAVDSELPTVCFYCGVERKYGGGHGTFAHREVCPWVRLRAVLGGSVGDREPHPTDGPDYHADHAAWQERRGSVGEQEATP